MLSALATVSSHHWKMIQNYGVTISKPRLIAVSRFVFHTSAPEGSKTFPGLDRSQKYPIPAEVQAYGVIWTVTSETTLLHEDHM